MDRPHLHTESFLYRQAHRFLGFSSGQAGFFGYSLHQVSTVEAVNLATVLAWPEHYRGRYDAVIVSAKSGLEKLPPDLLEVALSLRPLRYAILVPGARPKAMIPDSLADCFDVIFKREPWADLDRYALSVTNKAKICPTLISNPQDMLFTRLPGLRMGYRPRHLGYECPKIHDVFFLGRVGRNRYDNRVNAWRRICALEGVNATGGIIPDGPKTPIPPELRAAPLRPRAYRRALLRSRINLALDGIGPFTFRHLELFWSGSFCLSESDLSQIWLRVPAINGQDYVAFSDNKDMVEKILHYLQRPAEIQRIARNSRRLYERLFDPMAHAKEIRGALDL